MTKTTWKLLDIDDCRALYSPKNSFFCQAVILCTETTVPCVTASEQGWTFGRLLAVGQPGSWFTIWAQGSVQLILQDHITFCKMFSWCRMESRGPHKYRASRRSNSCLQRFHCGLLGTQSPWARIACQCAECWAQSGVAVKPCKLFKSRNTLGTFQLVACCFTKPCS